MYRRIRRSELNELAREWHFSFDDSELDEFYDLTTYIHDTTDGVEALPQPAPQNVPATRNAGHTPGDGEDPLNAVVRWCSVKLDGAEGVLSGTRIGLKDSIAVAGVPMTGGSNILRDFTPNQDSVVAERVLAAGGEIVAMLNMDYLAFSGGGDYQLIRPDAVPVRHEPDGGRVVGRLWSRALLRRRRHHGRLRSGRVDSRAGGVVGRDRADADPWAHPVCGDHGDRSADRLRGPDGTERR